MQRSLSVFLLWPLLFLLAAPAVLVDAGAPQAPAAAVTLTGQPYSQNFDTLAASGTSNTVPTGWEFAESGSNGNQLYTAGTGSSNTGDTYSFGAAGTGERAFGSVLSSTVVTRVGAQLQNGTGSTLTRFNLTFSCEQWRVGLTGRTATDRMDFQYSLDATSLTTGTWTDTDALDCLSSISNGTVGPADGNTQRILVSSSVSGISIPANGTFWIRWLDWDITNSDDGLAIDDVSLTTGDPAPTVTKTTPAAGATGVLLNSDVSITFSEPVNAAGAWYGLSCAGSGAHTAAVAGGPSTFVLNPDTDFTAGESCTLTIYASQVTDQDTNDPADNMYADYTASFTTAGSTPPAVVINEVDSDTPGTDALEFIELYDGGAGNTSLDGLVVVLYNGFNDQSYAAYDLDGYSTNESGYFLLGNSGVTPAPGYVFAGNILQNGQDAVALYQGHAASFPNNTPVTTATLLDALVYDTSDADDPGLLVLLNAGQPQVNEDAHALGETESNQRCPDGSGGQRNTNSYQQFLPTPGARNRCDAAPTVTSTTPPTNAVDVVRATNISITFSEPVAVSGAWYAISCTTSGSHLATVTGGPTSWTLDPDANFVGGESCTVTLYATQIADADTDDPPDTLATDYIWSFTVATGDPCTEPADYIHTIQGDGATSPVAGQTKTVQAVVIGDFQASSQLNGFFLQEERAEYDLNDATSEGIFVYQGSATLPDVLAGDLVRVTGTVTEYADRTVGGGTLTELTNPGALVICSRGNTVTAASPYLPEPVDGWLEHYEGMLVRFGTLTVTQNYYLGRYGQLSLSGSGKLYQPTNLYAPGSSAASAEASLNARSQLILDDGRSGARCGDNPNPVPYLAGPPPAVIRAGDALTGLVGVLDYGQTDSGATGPCSDGATLFAGDFRVHPTEAPTFLTDNPRLATPPAGHGNLRVVGANVLNFFNGDGAKGGFPTSRGATNFTEFVRQRIKLYEELSRTNADVISLMELENDGFGPSSAIAELVKVLNEGPCWNSPTECAALGYSSAGISPGTYAFVDLGGPVGDDEITVGLIYRPGRVTLVGAPAVLADAGYTDPNNTGSQKSRPAIAATFEEIEQGERFTVVANHFKSKGSCPASGSDADQGDGQGCWNDTRAQAAAYLVHTWLPTRPTGADAVGYLILGDLNAYAQEDPITALRSAGYTDLIARDYGGPYGYSYIFDGLQGYLDHALASPSLEPHVTGIFEWHVNADEPAVIDYDTDFNPPGYFAADPFRAADHDPVLIGLELYADLSDDATYGEAWHTGQGAWRLGTQWTGEPTATDGSDGGDDGVTRNYAASWNDGRGEVYVTVTGPAAGQYACLNAWLDYSDGSATAGVVETPNSTFDANERVIANEPIPAGPNPQQVTFSLPNGVINPAATYSLRFRLVPAPIPTVADCSGISAPALAPDGGAQPTGRADGGEAEDYSWQPGPLAVTIATFTATRVADGIALEWTTVSEVDNVGFDVLRGGSVAGPWTKVNETLIPSAAPGSGTGASYRWLDRTAQAKTAYWYLLVAEDTAGLRTETDPRYAPLRLLLPLVARDARPPLPYRLVAGAETCAPNAGVTYFNGVVRDRAGNLQNAVCVHVSYFGPRNTKCSGCDGVGDGNWGFSPFGGPAQPGIPVEIFVVRCPDVVPPGGQSEGFGDLTPLSEKWTFTTPASSMQCTGITFREN